MLPHYIDAFPMTPLCGAFLLPVGICIMLGAAFPRFRMALVIAGFAAGLALMAVVVRRLAPGLPPVHRLAIYSLVAAVIVEIVAFAIVMPRVRPKGPRAAGLTSLLIVGGHFLIMTPAFGPLIVILGLAALANAGWAWWRPDIGFLRTWAIDGALKIGVALAMLGTGPSLY